VFRHDLLVLRVVKNGRPVLRSGKPWVRRIVHLEKELQDLLVRPLVLVEGDPDRLGVVLDVPVGWVLARRVVRVPGGASRIPNDRVKDALLAIEIALRTPESSHGCLKGRRDVLGGREEGTDPAGFRFLGGYHVVVVRCSAAAAAAAAAKKMGFQWPDVGVAFAVAVANTVGDRFVTVSY